MNEEQTKLKWKTFQDLHDMKYVKEQSVTHADDLSQKLSYFRSLIKRKDQQIVDLKDKNQDLNDEIQD